MGSPLCGLGPAVVTLLKLPKTVKAPFVKAFWPWLPDKHPLSLFFLVRLIYPHSGTYPPSEP